MKIALIAHGLHPIKEPFEGGLEMITFLLCRSLMQRGHEVHLYAHRESDQRFDVRPIPTDRLRPECLLSSMAGMGQDETAVREMLAYTEVMNTIASEGYDIVHNHSLHYIPILMGNLLNANMVTSIHTPTFPYLQLGALGVEAHNHQTFTMVSQSLARTWKNLIPSATVVYNGIELSNWKFVARPKGNYLFWYGRICPEKGTDYAIEVAQRSGRKIILAGPISNRDYFNDKVAPLLKKKNVDYVGHCSQKEIAPLLANASALLFTSTWEEPYGLTLAESLACGTPIVAFEGGATREILTKNTGFVVPKHDVEGMARAIGSVAQIDRGACRERAETFCSHELMVKNYLDLYSRVLEQREYHLKLDIC